MGKASGPSLVRKASSSSASGILDDCFTLLRWTVKLVAFICSALAWLTSALCTSPRAKAVRFAYRDKIWPLALLVAIGTLGWCLASYPAWEILLGSLAGSAVVAFYLRTRLNRSAEWWYAGCCFAATTGWLTLQSGSSAVRVAGVLAWSGLSFIWWQHHEVRDHNALPKTPILGRWIKYIRDGDNKGSMTGADISGPVRFPYGDSYTIDLVPYKQTLGTAQSDLVNISSALDTPVQNLIIEAHPEYPGRTTKLRLQVVTKSPIKDTVYFDRPRYEDGRILLGPFADGMGEASVRLYTPTSMWGGFILGETGSGKTGLEYILAVTALAMRDAGQPTVLFYMDGQNGASSRILMDYADWSVGCDGVKTMMNALHRIAHYRQVDKRVHGWDFEPCPERPGIFVLVDEAHAVIPQCPELFDKAANEWRKLGMSIFIGDQGSDLKRTFGNFDTMRTALMAGNGVGMRCSSRISPNLVTGFDTNLADLPRLAGYGVITHNDPESGLRNAPFRCRHALTRFSVGDKPFRPVEEWFEQYPSLGLDPLAAQAAGADYANRHAQAETNRERDIEELRRMMGGEAPDGGTPPSPPPGGGVPPQRDSVATEAADAAATQSVALQILALEWAGVHEERTLQEIFEDLPGTVGPSAVNKALKKLVDGGELEKPGHGRYRRRVSVTT